MKNIIINSVSECSILSRAETKPNPQYPSTTGKPSGGGRGNVKK